MNGSELTYTKINYIIQTFWRIRRLSPFLYLKTKRKPSRRYSGRSVLNQSKEVLWICVAFQGSRD